MLCLALRRGGAIWPAGLPESRRLLTRLVDWISAGHEIVRTSSSRLVEDNRTNFRTTDRCATAAAIPAGWSSSSGGRWALSAELRGAETVSRQSRCASEDRASILNSIPSAALAMLSRNATCVLSEPMTLR